MSLKCFRSQRHKGWRETTSAQVQGRLRSAHMQNLPPNRYIPKMLQHPRQSGGLLYCILFFGLFLSLFLTLYHSLSLSLYKIFLSPLSFSILYIKMCFRRNFIKYKILPRGVRPIVLKIRYNTVDRNSYILSLYVLLRYKITTKWQLQND